MQEEILNTKNLSVLSRAVNNLHLVKDETEDKLKIGGVVLGTLNHLFGLFICLYTVSIDR